MITTISTHVIATLIGIVIGCLIMANNTVHAGQTKSTAAAIWAGTKTAAKTAWTWIRAKVTRK